MSTQKYNTHMYMLNRTRTLAMIILLTATFFSCFAKQTENVLFRFNTSSTFKQQPDPHSEPKPKTNTMYKMRVIMADKIHQAWENRYFLNLDLRTNMLYNVMLSPTIGFEWHKDRYWGFKLDGSYSRWGSDHGMVHNIWFLNPEVRRYIINTDRIYIGMGFNVGKVNIYRGVVGGLFFPEDTGYQSGFFGFSVSAGYKLVLTRYLTLDFSFGLGGTHFKYDSFTVIDQTRVYQKVKLKDVTKNMLGPTQAGVSLVWKISGHRNWR